MKRFGLVFIVAIKSAKSFTNQISCNKRRELFTFEIKAVPPRGGLTVEDPAQEGPSSGLATTLPFQNRGKVNEIDFCMSPSDVSLSRSYGRGSGTGSGTPIDVEIGGTPSTQQPRILSLTRALNNASNRALRRILLSRSWPSAEALNISLRQVLASKETPGDSDATDTKSSTDESNLGQDPSTAKCPVPRPILNVIMRQTEVVETNEAGFIDGATPASSSPIPPKRTDETWVEDQMKVFREGYGQLPGYEYADAYLECILSLATTGIESSRLSEVVAGGVYDDSYRRFLSVLKSVGTVFEGTDSNSAKMKIATKLIDQDICLSMLDKIAIRNEKRRNVNGIDLGKEEVQKANTSTETVNDGEQEEVEVAVKEETEEIIVKDENTGRNKLLFWMKPKKRQTIEVEQLIEPEDLEVEEEKVINPEDLGGVLLSAEEPTVTRQLNVLSNIVKRTLLFGGDQELLVLSETLNADKLAFIQRWYPNSGGIVPPKEETRPGVQYFNCLVQLLEDSYNYGEITDLDPPFLLFPSFANSYERLTAYLVELGSGYINIVGSRQKTSLPKTPTEELQRFTQWETSLRKTVNPDVSDYPEDLVGSWQVKDEIGGKIIGTSTVVFKPDGEVFVDPPVRGLRWRLDPGPTHLDTCTFQVLSEDGAILQYRGFMDRGARLESRFSKRSIKIRGAVTFQMRDGDSAMGADFKKDMLPITSQTGTTRFVMSKVFDLDS